jgi:hypothetical protein
MEDREGGWRSDLATAGRRPPTRGTRVLPETKGRCAPRDNVRRVPILFKNAIILKTAVGGEVLREDVEAAGGCDHPDAHPAVRGADGATA